MRTTKQIPTHQAVVEDWANQLLKTLQTKQEINGDNTAKKLNTLLSAEKLKQVNDDDLLLYMYYVDMLKTQRMGKIQNEGLGQWDETYIYLFAAIYNHFLEVLACRKEGITQEKFREMAADEYDLWVSSDNQDFRYIQNRFNYKYYEVIENDINEIRFKFACQKLENAVNDDNHNATYKPNGKAVLEKARMVKGRGMVASKELPTLIKDVDDAANLILNPTPENILIHSNNTQEAVNSKHHWRRILGGAMLGLLGVTLIASSIAVMVLTLGASAPLSIAGLAVGLKVVTIGATVVALTAGIGFSTAGGFYVNRERKIGSINEDNDIELEHQQRP